MDLNFEQLLAQHNQDFKEAEVYNNWMPPDGDYIVSLVKLDKGSSAKDGVSLAWWRLTGRIEDVQDEKLNGKEFPVGYYTSKAYGILKGVARTLSNNPILDDLAEAHAVLEAAIGGVVRVKVKTSFSEKFKKDFTNCYIQEVINTTAEGVSNETDPAAIETSIGDAPDSGVPAEAAPAEVPGEPPVQVA